MSENYTTGVSARWKEIKSENVRLRQEGRIAYEALGSRKPTEGNWPEGHKNLDYQYQIRYICSLCRHVSGEQFLIYWKGENGHPEYAPYTCEGCGEKLSRVDDTPLWKMDAEKSNNVIAAALMRHYPE